MSKPAFPRPFSEDARLGSSVFNEQNGMNLLEYYAGQALAGLMANPERYKYISALMKRTELRPKPLTQEGATEKNVTKAFLIAEAMIKESENWSK